MKPNLLFVLLFAGIFNTSGIAYSQTKVSNEREFVTIENRYLSLSFNLNKGIYDIKDKIKNSVPVKDAYFQAEGLNSKNETEKIEWSQEELTDCFGKGKTLRITARFKEYVDIVWEATVYDQKEFIVFNLGIINDTPQPYTLTTYYPLRSAKVFTQIDLERNYAVLNGNSGGNKTYVTDSKDLLCFNNLMIRCGDLKNPNILVAGGLTYYDFEKFCALKKSPDYINLKIWAEDPVGKLIDPGTTYKSKDKFYCCVNNLNPFEALEKYGLAVKEAQNIKLNYYDFPTECLWYASVYAKDPNRPKFNDSKGAVDEMDNAIKSGFTKYSRVAIRLVPDAYGPNNQQGWWDDHHWAMWGDQSSAIGANYVAPYLTTESWCQEIIKKGGIPMTYTQTNRRSEDFVKAHPDWMLFNDSYKISSEHATRLRHNCEWGDEVNDYHTQHWSENNMYGYDFTDTSFVKHMRKVYSNLKEAGIKGIMYDYPEATGWAYAGGFDDKHSTTANAYRSIYKLASEGLDSDAYIDERMLVRGTDVASGLTASQRIWGDNDLFKPEMVQRSGLRWYKNRVFVSYDLDAKDPLKAQPAFNNDGLKTLMTMTYVVSGRFLMARGFYQLSKDQLFVMSRTFPYHSTPQSSRPIDAFNKGVKIPRIFDYEVNPDWHQLTLYNPNLDSIKSDLNTIEVQLGNTLNEGGLALDGQKNYYLYDFWNNTFTGKFKGNDVLIQDLRIGETRMISIHAEEKIPQFISTNRHIMQGYVDMVKFPVWNSSKNELSGVSKIIGGETYRVILALNGYKALKVNADGAKASIRVIDEESGLAELSVDKIENGNINWVVTFRN